LLLAELHDPYPFLASPEVPSYYLRVCKHLLHSYAEYLAQRASSQMKHNTRVHRPLQISPKCAAPDFKQPIGLGIHLLHIQSLFSCVHIRSADHVVTRLLWRPKFPFLLRSKLPVANGSFLPETQPSLHASALKTYSNHNNVTNLIHFHYHKHFIVS
jgi:hypothetical protein